MEFLTALTQTITVVGLVVVDLGDVMACRLLFIDAINLGGLCSRLIPVSSRL